ncbi:hypothetical protein CA13_37450 [Planctomycetes bacterium CA13]|uniref:Uncharacterized protein n=1 Tax=Novipirellula herctigrandis TaxID=2527986 RepID=A0A5C5Z6W9_9BACT|nr:hypothetical protein CA13_37450 [Planctomycetes bacterium CA13]
MDRLIKTLTSAIIFALLTSFSTSVFGQWRYAERSPIQTEGELHRDSSLKYQPAINNFHNLDLPAPYCYEPVFGADVGFLGLIRSSSDAFALVTNDSSEVVATSDALDPEMKLGYRVSATLFNLSRHVQGLDTGISFFSVGGTVGESVIGTPGDLSTNLYPHFYAGTPTSPQSSYSIFLESDLDSAEWMIGYRPIPRLRLSAGVRWLKLDENFDVLRTAELSTGTRLGFYAESHNDAFGFQVGGEGTLWTNGSARVYFCGKYAALNNEVEGKAIAQNITFDYEGDTNTSLVDIEIGAHAWVASWASVGIAYQGLFLADAVGALEQSDQQSMFDAALQKPFYHDITWHGLHVGIKMIW